MGSSAGNALAGFYRLALALVAMTHEFNKGKNMVQATKTKVSFRNLDSGRPSSVYIGLQGNDVSILLKFVRRCSLASKKESRIHTCKPDNWSLDVTVFPYMMMEGVAEVL